MKISGLFSLLTSTTGLLDFFEGVESEVQLISRLERLKRQAPDALLDSIYVARSTITEVLDDTIETTSTVEGEDMEFEDTMEDDELENLTADEKQIPENPPASGNEKT